MTVTVSKPALILREEISALKKPSGIKGEELLRSNTVSDAYTALNPVMFRNRIINGDMRIDQRNNGGTVSGHVTYPVDRFRVIKDTGSGTMTMNRSSTAPAGFNTSVVYTVGTAYTPGSGENNFFVQLIEGYQTADFGWGTAGAVPVTLSFWVRCSLAGYFGGSLRNGSSNKSFIFSYTITAPDVWEYKTITIPGCTDGTWDKTTGNGVELVWGFAVGSNYSNAPGGWYAGNYISATNAKFISSTAGATWFMTGAQLEKGTVATPFEHRSFGAELALCQRYYQVINQVSWNQGQASRDTATESYHGQQIQSPMRIAPTIATYDNSGNPSISCYRYGPGGHYDYGLWNSKITAIWSITTQAFAFTTTFAGDTVFESKAIRTVPGAGFTLSAEL